MVAVPHDLASRLDAVGAPRPRLQFAGELRDAAVVALLMPADPEQPHADPRVVLIERSVTLRNHAGQVALPGGKPDPGDGDLATTALREANEEIGLPMASTRVVGRLAPVPTPTGFVIWPFVAWAPPVWEPAVHSADEVAAVLTPRLSVLADPAVHSITGRGVWKGFPYEMHEFAIHQPPVWGATARIVWDLLQRIRR